MNDQTAVAVRAEVEPLLAGACRSRRSRDAEGGHFLRRWRKAQVREGGFALVSGDPGTGKSVVMRLVADRLGGSRRASVSSSIRRAMSPTSTASSATCSTCSSGRTIAGRASRRCASALVRALKVARPSLQVFMDRQELNPGAAWQVQLFESLERSRGSSLSTRPSTLSRERARRSSTSLGFGHVELASQCSCPSTD